MRRIASLAGFLFLFACAFADVAGTLTVHAPAHAHVVVKALSEDRPPIEGDADETGSIKFDSLPIGDYSVTVNGETQSVVIRVNAVTEISFPIEKRTEAGDHEETGGVVSLGGEIPTEHLITFSEIRPIIRICVWKRPIRIFKR